MTPISTGYQPRFGLGALYQGFNAGNADSLNEEEVLKALLQNQKEQNEAPLNQIIKTWEARQAQGKMDDPEYLPKSLEGYKGQMNSQIAAGNKGMGTYESEIATTNAENKNKSRMANLFSQFIDEQLGQGYEAPTPLEGSNGQMGFNFGSASNALKNPNLSEQHKQLILQDSMKRGENPLQNFSKIQNALVNTPEQLQKLAQIQAKGDEALQLQGLRNESALAVAMQRLQDKSGKPLSMKDTIAKAARIIHGLEPGDVKAARMVMRELENSQLRSNPAGYAPGGINLQGTQESGKYQTFPSPVQQSGALNIQGILPSINSAPTGTLSDGTKFTVKNNK